MLPDDFRFEDPVLLLLAAVIPLVFLWESWRAARRPSLTYSNVAALDAPPGIRVRLRWLPTFLRAVALSLVVFALARPQSGEAEALAPTEGIDIVLALDVSASMQQEDFGGQARVEGAKSVAAQFVGERDTDRVAVVGFRRHSLILSPLTVDYAAVQAIISRADTVNLEDGTGIGVAIAESANLLRDSRATSRIVVLLTDGENNEASIQPIEAARIAEALGIRVYTIGILSALRGPDQVVPEVNPEELAAVSEATDGKFYSARDPETLARIYDEIATLEKSRIDDTRFTRYDELAWILLLPAFALLAIELLLRATLLRRLP
jgi:Ca-activated chloride channel homolog